MDKLTWRIWLLVIILGLSAISILNLPTIYDALVGILIISILLILSYSKTKSQKIILIFLVSVGIVLIILFTAQKGALITSVSPDSQAFSEGLRKGLIITSINGNPIVNSEDYSVQINSLFSSSQQIKIDFTTTTGEFVFLANETPSLSVSDIPFTNLKTGLDLSGGARAIVRPVNVSLSSAEMADLISVTSNRLNTFGISDVNVRSASDLEGNNFMLVEVAGLTTEDLRQLVGQQGKFEAKLGNDVVFIGGKRDITSVCRNDATCAGIESCQQDSSGNYYCNFRFSVYLSEAAAERHANISGNIPLDPNNPQYLAEKLDLFLDDKLVDSLYVGAELKGRVTTQIQISGSGTGATNDDAYNDAQNNMHKLQTILITGSLPYKLEIVKLDSVSPTLGKQFTKNIILLGLIVFFIVSLVLFLKYKKIKITLAVILTLFSEVLITLGIAALINWNLDAPSIAGIIAGMGTGVDAQIVIIDESISEKTESLKDKIKRAFFIIFGSFFTVVAAMLPLFWAGAGLLRGFALTTILVISVGILITRPVFGDIIKKIQE